MNTKEALKVLVGSITVYCAMAACSSAGHPTVSSALADVNAGGTRLKANYYAGSDGSQLFLMTFHDTKLNEDCAFTTAADGTVRCLPSGNPKPGTAPSTYGVYYADAACTQPIVAVSTCSGNTTPKYFSIGGGPFGGSTKGPALYTLGSPTSVATAYQLGFVGPGPNPNACNGPFTGLTPTCTPVPATSVDGGTGGDAGSAPPPGFGPPPAPPAWSSIESTSTIYSLVGLAPSEFVEATTKTTM